MKTRILLTAIAALGLIGTVAGTGDITVNEGVVINDPGNGTTIETTNQLNVTDLDAYNGTTNIDGINLSVVPEGGNTTSLGLSYLNNTANDGVVWANFTATPSTPNNVEFVFKNGEALRLYAVQRNGTYIQSYRADNQGDWSFKNNEWSTKQFLISGTNDINETIEQDTKINSTSDADTSYGVQVVGNTSTDDVGDAVAEFIEAGVQVVDIQDEAQAIEEVTVQDITVFDQDYGRTEYIHEGDTAHIRATVQHAGGRSEIDTATVTLRDEDGDTRVTDATMTDIGDIPNGNLYEFNYTLPTTLQDGGEWEVDVTANDTGGDTDTLTSTFVHQVVNDIEQPKTQGDATIFEDVPFTEQADYENPSDTGYQGVEVDIKLPSDTRTSTLEIRDGGGNPVSYDYNATTTTATFNIGDLAVGSNKIFDASYDVKNLSVQQASFNTLDNAGRNVTVKEFNLSRRGPTNFTDLTASTEFQDDNNIVSLSLRKDGQEVTTEADYSFNTVDTNNDGTEETAEWVVPEVGPNQTYQVRAIRGFPLKVEREDVITNKPVTEAKNIEWRTGLRFINRNNFPITVDYKVRIPLESSNIIYEDDIQTKVFDNQGTYVPITFQLSGNSNQTRFLEYTTPTINIETERIRPDEYFINKETREDINVTFINELSLPVKDVQARTQILEGTDLETTLENGTVIDEQDFVEGTYDFTISDVDANSDRQANIEFTAPVANATYLGARNISSGNELDVWDISSTSPVSRQNVRFTTDKFSCVEAQRAFLLGNNETKEIRCEDLEPKVVIGTLGPNEEFQLGIEHKEYNIVVENGLVIFSIVSSNVFLAAGSLLSVILLLLGYQYVIENFLKRQSFQPF